MVAVLMLTTAACGAGGKVTIGTQTYTETKILAHMMALLIEDQADVNVEVKEDFAASPPVISAMDEGEVDIATLYTGEVFNNYFPVEQTHDPEEVLKQAQEGFDEHYGFKWFESYGYENTYVMAVRSELAEAEGLEKVSDLEPIAEDLRLGVDTTWNEREHDGYPAFQEHYGFSFGEVFPMEIGLVYDALKNKEVDIITAYSTDARLKAYDLKMLEDDTQFFPPFDACPVAVKETLEEYPEVETAIEQLIGKIDPDTIISLSYEVDVENRKSKEVAEEFLKDSGLLD